MSKKKKRSEQEKQEIAKSLRGLLGKEDLAMKHISATIINGNEQPIILSSNEDLTKHIINLGDGTSMMVPTKMIPYLSIALKILMAKHINEHFEGDKAEIKKFDESMIEEISDMEFFDLTGCGEPDCEDCNSGSCSKSVSATSIMSQEMPEMQESFEMLEQIQTDETIEAIREMKPEDAQEIVENLMECKDIAEDTMKELKKGNLSETEQKELREEANKKMMEHLKEVESKLTGTIADKKRVIDYAYIKKIMEKHGPQAAQEELMRLPEEQRDILLQQVLDGMKKGM